MKFDEALENFKTELIKEYGVYGSLIEVSLTQSFFDRILLETVIKHGIKDLNSLPNEIYLDGIKISK